MRLELVRFEATDGVTLPGLLYEPRRRADDAVVFLHGNGDSSVFYSARTNILAEELTRRGMAWFPFNNRGAHTIKGLSRRRGAKSESLQAGMAHERIRDCVHDIDGAVRLLRTRGYRRIHLVGHSTGANKICVYSFFKPRNPITSYVLFAGADDSGLYRSQYGLSNFRRRMERSRAMIRAKRGAELVPSSWSFFPISYASLFDTINPDGDYNTFPFLEVLDGPRLSRKRLFRHYESIRKPTLALYGSEEEYCFGRVGECVELLRRRRPPGVRFEFDIVTGANHGFSGMERVLGERIADWVAGPGKRRGSVATT
jgi:pimeloyl-ACP methyl ester carboxylesterase